MGASTAVNRISNLQLGKYRVLAHIASGGMGAVYKAVDTETGQEVALKVLAADAAARPASLERFRREARHGARLRHDNVVSLIEFGEAQGTYFLVMEFVDGINLHEHINLDGPLHPDEARHYLCQIVSGLDHVHQQGIVHRDIKPSNILLVHKDGRTIAKLIDLGLALETRDEDFRVTRDGTTVGTVDYLAPEQARNSRAADIRSDIYSLGCTFYHMLSGCPPFSEGSLTERIYKHAEAPPPDVRSTNPKVSADLWAICRRMLAKKPCDRYQTPAELLHDLARLDPPARAKFPREEKPAALAQVRSPLALDLDAAVVPTGVGDTGPATLVADDSSPASFEQRQIAHRQFRHAAQVIASGDYDYGIQLLFTCCRFDPANPAFRQALRQAHKKGGKPPYRFLHWLRTLRLVMRLHLAKKRRQHLQILQLGEEVLSCRPGALGVQLDMAAAARAAGFTNLAIWILEQAKQENQLDVRVNRALSQIFESQKDLARAMSLWESVLRADPNNREAHNQMKDLAARETIARGHYEQQAVSPRSI